MSIQHSRVAAWLKNAQFIPLLLLMVRFTLLVSTGYSHAAPQNIQKANPARRVVYTLYIFWLLYKSSFAGWCPFSSSKALTLIYHSSLSLEDRLRLQKVLESHAVDIRDMSTRQQQDWDSRDSGKFTWNCEEKQCKMLAQYSGKIVEHCVFHL